MKKLAFLLVICAVSGLLTACASKQKQEPGERYAKKIYLTKEDYLEDLGNVAQTERREVPATAESKYIFNVAPDTETNVYFFDRRQQPKVPGEYTAADYKGEKRLWTKPKRFTHEQYYGMQGSSSDNESSSSYDY